MSYSQNRFAKGTIKRCFEAQVSFRFCLYALDGSVIVRVLKLKRSVKILTKLSGNILVTILTLTFVSQDLDFKPKFSFLFMWLILQNHSAPRVTVLLAMFCFLFL